MRESLSPDEKKRLAKLVSATRGMELQDAIRLFSIAIAGAYASSNPRYTDQELNEVIERVGILATFFAAIIRGRAGA